MPPLSYSVSPSPHRDSIVRALTAYYTLLVEFPYLSVDAICHSPSGGWNLDVARGLQEIAGKSASVLDVLNYIPYLATERRDLEIAYDTAAIDWREKNILSSVAAGNFPILQQRSLEPMCQKIPDNMISLTTASLYGRWSLLSANTGMVTDYSIHGGPDYDWTDEDEEAGLGWTKYESRYITDLFEDWSEKLRSPLWIPLPGQKENTGTIRTPCSVDDPEQELYRANHRDHGWTSTGHEAHGTGFRKEECRAALVDLEKELFRQMKAKHDESRGAKAKERRARLLATAAASADEL